MLAGTLSLHNTEIDSIQWIMLLIREITFRADHKKVSSCNQNSRLFLTSDFSLHWILERKWEESSFHKNTYRDSFLQMKWMSVGFLLALVTWLVGNLIWWDYCKLNTTWAHSKYVYLVRYKHQPTLCEKDLLKIKINSQHILEIAF